MVARKVRNLVLAGITLSLLLGILPTAAAHAVPASLRSGAVAPSPILAISAHYTIPTGKASDGLAYDPSTTNVYISNQGSNNVTVIDSTTHTHSSIPVGKSPYGVAFDPYNSKVYVPNYNSSNVTIISASTDKAVANPSLGAHARPIGAIFDPASGDVLVLNSSAGLGTGVGWMIINSTNAVKKITFGTGTIDSYGYNPKTKDLYLPNLLSGSVSAISGSGTVTSIKTGGYPTYVYVNPSNNYTYAYGPSGGTHSVLRISMINTANKVVKNLTVRSVQDSFINRFGYDPATKNSYFLGYNDTTNKSALLVISSKNSVSATVALGSGELGFVSYDPANGDMYVTSAAKTITVVSGTTVVKTLTVSQTVPLLIYDPTLKDMVGTSFVNLTTVSTFYAITSSNTVSTLTVGKGAVAPFYDPKDTYVYVVNIGSKDVELVG